MAAGASLLFILLICLAAAAGVLLLIFVLVPIFKGIGWLIGSLFRGIGFLIVHVFSFIGGMISDTLRFVGAVIASVVLVPMALLNLIVGRWSGAGHFAESVKRECKVAGSCLYRIALQRPLKLLFLHGLLEGVEQRVPEAMAAAPTSDRPSRRVGQFPGYTIVGSLRGGGSGAKLYIAEPDGAVRARYRGMPSRVVIKAFALSEGSTLPQILRESRALECAKQLGLVFEHGMDEKRFYYVMPYHAGDHLGIVTRQLHGETDGQGLGSSQLATMLSYITDLVATLSTYHRGGLWHKDVKPENIIINRGQAHLVDLGLVTPLRSAMTLTTHGTEYFRDPELVRQALRGVKVHQIDGAKFDVYAAGAVTYFMIENTFPPHGALSRFTRRSPDALRWIVRRAMADYAHRYVSADEMLADLRFVAAAPDCFAVKPADLPSMTGRVAEAVRSGPPWAVPDEARPADEALEGVARELDGAAAFAVAVGSPTPPARADARPRPKLEVTNWWTGAYRPAGEPAGMPPPRPAVWSEHDALRHAREHAALLRSRVRTGTRKARKAAREQVRTARHRARERRRQARAHRQRAVAERQPSFALTAIGLAAVLLMAALVVSLYLARGGGHGGPTTIVVRPGDDPGVPVLLVDNSVGTDREVATVRVAEIADRYRARGYDVVTDEALVEGGMRTLLREWEETKGRNDEAHEAIDQALELALQEHDLSGVLNVTGTGRRLSGSLLWSENEGAADRRHQRVLKAPAVQLPYLLVNDHPIKYDPEVASSVDLLVRRFESAGWEVIVDDEVEVRVRSALPAGRIEPGAPMPELLQPILERAGLGGIVYVTAPPGDRSPREHVRITTIDAQRPAQLAETPPADAGTSVFGEGDGASAEAGTGSNAAAAGAGASAGEGEEQPPERLAEEPVVEERPHEKDG